MYSQNVALGTSVTKADSTRVEAVLLKVSCRETLSSAITAELARSTIRDEICL